MGIQGLHPLLKEISHEVGLSDMKGKTVCIDGFAWLHRSCTYHAKELASSSELTTTKFIFFFVHAIEALRKAGATPFFVFDGGNLPSKAEEDAHRRESRDKALKNALECERLGKYEEAQAYYRASVSITPAIIHNLLFKLRSLGVRYMFAPYEADAQMTYLCHKGYVDAIIAEDGDMLAHWAPCVYFKFNYSKNYAVRVEIQKDLHKLKDFKGYSQEDFLRFCVMIGCDYLSRGPGLGPVKAHKFVSASRKKPLDSMLKLIESGHNVEVDYAAKFVRARQTFLHQRVFDPATNATVSEWPLEADLARLDEKELDFLGAHIPSSIATAISRGLIDPVSRQRIVYTVNNNNNILSLSYSPISEKEIQSLLDSNKDLNPFPNMPIKAYTTISSRSITSYGEVDLVSATTVVETVTTTTTSRRKVITSPVTATSVSAHFQNKVSEKSTSTRTVAQRFSFGIPSQATLASHSRALHSSPSSVPLDKIPSPSEQLSTVSVASPTSKSAHLRKFMHREVHQHVEKTSGNVTEVIDIAETESVVMSDYDDDDDEDYDVKKKKKSVTAKRITSPKVLKPKSPQNASSMKKATPRSSSSAKATPRTLHTPTEVIELNDDGEAILNSVGSPKRLLSKFAFSGGDGVNTNSPSSLSSPSKTRRITKS